ncbi:Receptor y region, transmembrane domain- and RING domain-containing protein 2 [Choanephora cucurbitarum]|uniref:RING-type E3 ubiquitin transferase n=1 Tax=Choanephora cucurbitarum TaxID=101091 RepID=A0A1C7NIK9_9FUNG|nr:Receptor y region, transmembrane domain- and RING domain-containing protein 2 [Choanephora cucurbitarum]
MFPMIHAMVYIAIANETLEDRPAVFGPTLSNTGKIGFVVEPSDDPTGCTIVQPPCSDWIALVRRGSCSFVSKVRYMQKSGAVAVIVGDPEQPGWVTMYTPGDASDIVIPSVFVAKEEYHKLLNLSKLVGTPVLSVISHETSSTVRPWIDLIILLIILPMIMICMIYIFWKVKQHILRQRELAPVLFVSQLNMQQGEEEEGDSCAICLEEYGVGDELRLLPCQHQFHASCVDAWLTTQKKLCPICKRDVTSHTTTEITPLLLEAGYA